MNCKICTLQKCHVDAVYELNRECFSLPWTREAIENEIENPLSFFIVTLDENDRVIGYGSYMAVVDTAYIANIGVSPDLRRRGVADVILNALCKNARETQLEYITLEVRSRNLPAIGLYEKHGFVLAGRRKGYYQNPEDDALIMTRDLN